jgi:hypothetical protein
MKTSRGIVFLLAGLSITIQIAARDASQIYFDTPTPLPTIGQLNFSLESNRLDVSLQKFPVHGVVTNEIRSGERTIWDFQQQDERHTRVPCPPAGPNLPPPPSTTCASLWLTAEEISELLAGQWTFRVSLTERSGTRIFETAILPRDTDRDSVPDFRDLCADTPLGSIVNEDGCGIDQLAPCNGFWRNHGEYVSVRKHVIRLFADDGLISKEEEKRLCAEAARLDCGEEAE